MAKPTAFVYGYLFGFVYYVLPGNYQIIPTYPGGISNDPAVHNAHAHSPGRDHYNLVTAWFNWIKRKTGTGAIGPDERLNEYRHAVGHPITGLCPRYQGIGAEEGAPAG
jgi:hypothetical protein